MAFSVSHFGLTQDDLPFGWRADRLDALAVLNPEQIVESYPHSEIQYLDIANVGAGMVEKPANLSLADAPSRAKRIVRRNDSILSTVRPGNRAYAFLQEVPSNLIVSTGFAVLRAKPNAADPRFVYYLATSDPIVDYLASIAEEKTAYPSVNPSDIAECIVPIPPLSEQRAIAHILGTLDDKIDLNRRMNETLEAMAQAIFKSWFVDATLEGLPKGWTESELGEIAEVIDCLHSKKPERQPTGKPLLQLANIRDDGLIEMTDTCYITENDYRYWISRMEGSPGDCVITNVGRVAATAQIPEGLRAALGRNMTGVRCRSSFPYPSFLIECLRSSAMKEEIVHKTDTGTILDALNVRNIPKLRFVKPTDEVAARFEAICRPLRAKMEQNVAESRNLAAIRDALLPKLLSGKIRVEDAEKLCG